VVRRAGGVVLRLDGKDRARHLWRADGVTILREGLDPDSYRSRSSDCFTGETYALPLQLALQGKTTFDYRIFSYEDVGTATLEDGVYARSEDLKYPDRIQRIARFLAGARAGWQSAADEARKAAEFLAEKTAPPAPDLATLLRAIWAANDLVEVGRMPFGHLDPAAYDRTVTILLTAAPDPLLKTAPLGAVSDTVIKAMEAGVAADCGCIALAGDGRSPVCCKRAATAIPR
jgi:NitT/TauT family transport system substrate-binding protein